MRENFDLQSPPKAETPLAKDRQHAGATARSESPPESFLGKKVFFRERQGFSALVALLGVWTWFALVSDATATVSLAGFEAMA